MTSEQLKVGDTVIVDGEPTPIIGETRVNWKVQVTHWRGPLTFPKRPDRPEWIMTSEDRRGYGGHRVFITKQDWLRHEWAKDHRQTIATMVIGAEFSTLHAVAKLVGYENILPEE